MTPNEIIALARIHFGEPNPLTISSTDELVLFNESMREIYSDLPSDRLKSLISEDTVTITGDNRGPVDSSWDRVIEVYVNDRPAIQAPKETIRNSELSSYFAPAVPIFHVDEQYLWVRPHETGDVVKAVYLSPPSTVVTGGRDTEITEIHEAFHEAVALLLASYMYAQEEDLVQAQHYKGEYVSVISNLSSRMAAGEA